MNNKRHACPLTARPGRGTITPLAASPRRAPTTPRLSPDGVFASLPRSAGADEARPMQHTAFAAHRRHPLASVVAQLDGQLVCEERGEHERGALTQFPTRCERGSPVAVETTRHWYWIVDEIEAAASSQVAWPSPWRDSSPRVSRAAVVGPA